MRALFKQLNKLSMCCMLVGAYSMFTHTNEDALIAVIIAGIVYMCTTVNLILEG